MNKTRLLLLADALETRVPADHFDLREWREGDDGRNVSDGDLLNHECGTVACAVGWACALPEFKAEGLSYDGAMPDFKGSTHFCAVNDFFEIGYAGSRHLFLATEYPDNGAGPGADTGPLEVAARIRAFVASME